MVDYQFLGMVAVGVAVLTRGSPLPVIVVTAFVGSLLLVCELGLKWYRNRRPRPAAEAAEPVVPDADVTQWLAALQRVLSSKD